MCGYCYSERKGFFDATSTLRGAYTLRSVERAASLLQRSIRNIFIHGNGNVDGFLHADSTITGPHKIQRSLNSSCVGRGI